MSIELRAVHTPGLALAFLVSVLSAPAAWAATSPLTEQIEQSAAPVYGGLAQANHVFGYRFRALEAGSIDSLGGRFSGSKQIVLINEANDVLGTVRVRGQQSGFQWASLSEPVSINAGESYRVLMRTGTSATAAAVWNFPMPYQQGGIEVLSLEQGWSSETEAAEWAASAQSLSEQHARGLVDIRFTAVSDPDVPPVDPDEPTDPTTDPTTDPVVPSGADPYPMTAGVIDSFGQAAPTGPMGMGFMAVSAYYRDHPRQSGECSQAVHDRYWVKDAAGVSHPTWHPPVDPVTGCRFAHEHGDDPRGSPNYAFAQGVPFGLTHGQAEGVMRHEDHVGHKVVVQNDWGLVDGNPQNGRQPDTDRIRRTGIRCDWLSKLHQGSWSRDALANNAHEYFLNLRCTDGVELRLKQLVTFGPPELVTNLCGGPAVGQGQALSRFGQTSEAFPSGVAATSGVPVSRALDGKREFACLDNLIWKDRLEELWKSDGVIELPAGGFINFSPYYVVFNPARYLDHRWAASGAADGYVSSVDLCFDDNTAYRGRPMGFCSGVPAALEELSSDARQRDIRNPMNGTSRVIHPKNIVVYSANEEGGDDLIDFCTDRLGRNARIPDEGGCESDEIEQLVSRSDRRQWGWSGSDVNAITVNGELRGAGYLAEWPRDFSAPGIRYPN